MIIRKREYFSTKSFIDQFNHPIPILQKSASTKLECIQEKFKLRFNILYSCKHVHCNESLILFYIPKMFLNALKQIYLVVFN